MIDRSNVGRTFEARTSQVSAWQARFFAKTIGETQPIYFDEQAAHAAGFRSIVVPATFVFSVEFESDAFGWVEELGVVTAHGLHAEQSFDYYEDVCVGDELTFRSRIADIYTKKDGALEFIVRETEVTNQFDRKVAGLRTVVVIRHA